LQIDTLLNQAEQHHRAGRLDEAAGFYKQALTLAPDHADAQYGLGTVLMQQNRCEEAVSYLQAAIRSLPGVPEFHFNLALCLGRAERMEEAKAELLRAAGLAGRELYLLLPICTKMIEFGLAGQAYGCLDAIGATEPKAILLKAKALGALGDWRGAAKIMAALAQQTPDDPVIWFEHSKAAGFLRDYDTAIASYETYLSLKVPGGEDYLRHADLLLTARHPARAKEALARATGEGVDRAEAHHIAAKCARLEGNEAEVRKHVDLALERRPAFGQVWQLKSEILPKSELAELAKQCTELTSHASSTEWDRVMLEITAGQAYEKAGCFDAAFAAFKRGNELHKPLLKNKNFEYCKDDTETESNRIIGHFPIGETYEIARTEEDEPKAVFIVGMPRSGTTLVERILACLEGVEAGGENEALEFVATQYYWDLAQGLRPGPGALPQETLQGMASVYWQKTPHNMPVVTDKMPHNFRHVGLICQIFPKAPIIYMKRDPRDVCLSIYSRLFSEAHRYAVDLDWLAHFYAQNERLKRHWMEVFPGRILEVDYECLVDKPVEKTREIADFCDLEWHPGCLDFHKNKGASFTFSELQVRKPLNREGIDRWRRYEKHLAPLTRALERYGVL
jgi:tetratricopeptide (TPR) repeat protein